jgi:hypothetical protein
MHNSLETFRPLLQRVFIIAWTSNRQPERNKKKFFFQRITWLDNFCGHLINTWHRISFKHTKNNENRNVLGLWSNTEARLKFFILTPLRWSYHFTFLCSLQNITVIRANRRFQWPRGLRRLAYCNRGCESHRGHGCLSVVCCVCC